MKITGQIMIIMSAVLAGASLDGWAADMFGFGGLIGRLAIFTVSFMLGVWLEKTSIKRKRAKRMAVLKAHKNNKYSVICHS